MERRNAKIRGITFMSVKNGTTVTVHSNLSRFFATLLEADDTVKSYETNWPLNMKGIKISALGIRSSYFETEWTTDFYVERTSGDIEVIEVVDAPSMEKKAVVEQLELSRRYWKSRSVNSWKIAIVERGETAW